MKVRTYYINLDTSKLTDSVGTVLMTPPTFTLGSKPTVKFCFAAFNGDEMIQADLTDATKWRAVIDTDLNINTAPMAACPTSAAIITDAASGIIGFPIDCSTSGFAEKTNGKDSTAAWMELYGFNQDQDVIYDYRFRVNCLGTVELDHSEPEPPEPEPDPEEPIEEP